MILTVAVFMLAAAIVAVTFSRRRLLRVGGTGLHLSLALILIGAAITHRWGERGRVSLHIGSTPVSQWTMDGGSTAEFPFRLQLVDCGVEYHPGVSTARDYYSVLRVSGSLEPDREFRISMNNTLDIDGYRFTQAGLGDGTSTLGVSHDPIGTGVSFTAYGLLFLFMGWVLLGSRRYRALIRRVGAGAAVLMLSFPAYSAPKVLQRPLADTYGRIYVVYSGRVCQLQTLARDFAVKVHGSPSYKGLTPEQLLTGWIYYYNDWKKEPFIKLKSHEARDIADARYVALGSLFTTSGYLLEPALSPGNAPSASLLADDEKVSMVARMVTGRGVDIFLPDDSLASFAITRTMEGVAEAVAHGRYNRADSLLREVVRWQEDFGHEAVPGRICVVAERLRNTTSYPIAAAIISLLAAGIAIGFMRGNCRWRWVAGCVAVIPLLYLSYMIVLRWIISGHIPLSSGYETMMALAWICLVVSVTAGIRVRILQPLGLLAAGAALMVASIGAKDPSVSPLIPVLSSRLLSLHVMLVMASYALFAMIALNSIYALLSRSDIRMHGSADVSVLLLYPAVFLLGAGIFVGAIWADRSWGRYWGWDPKETCALVTFILYALPLHSLTFKWFSRPRNLHIYLAVAFLSVIMTYYGVNFLRPGLHSY
ncbi:MAG: cytochrome c biogenesis protein CcsA [Muribaculaceae bacterium]|nr:cytochrome c biogenesis protein CcsA [Muribaculaceae bacterium]